jgi:membrane-bound lytic murein transglycosylase D
MRRKRKFIRESQRVLYSMGILLGLILLFKLMNFSAEEETQKEGDIPYKEYFKEHYRIFSLQLPDSLNFAGEPVPMKDLDVREKLDRELHVNTYWQSHSILLHKRAHRWFPIIGPILEDEGVPEDLKYIPLVESDFRNQVSPAGAAGFWQFMKGTAKEYGLEVDGNVDERYHVKKATRAACEYLKKAYERYGSWTMAAASYNVGMSALDDRILQQKAKSYYQLKLNNETARYVYRILALKEIHQDPSEYGFHLRQKDLYQPYRTRTLKVDTPIDDLAEFAIEEGTGYKELKILNPWLREDHLDNASGKSYRILLPAEDSEQLIHKDSSIFKNDTLQKRIEKDSFSKEERPKAPREDVE